jgi:acyl-CoA synthetase (AMP-forming)/AMP-acid ligase II
MILGDPTATAAAPQHGQRRLTIDEVFGRIALKYPDRPALIDAPNREAFTDGAPRGLTYGEADRVVTAIAGRLHRMGLAADSVVAIQLPNTVDNILMLLGVLRAGLIAAPLPLLWRRAETVAALARLGAKALITCSRAGSFQHAQFALRIASEVFSIRYVCGFGGNLPDGAVPFDDLFAAEELDAPPPLERQQNAAAHLAFITFDVGEGGIVPVARNHLEAVAGGLGVALEGHLSQDARILSAIAPASFAGLSLTFTPWLLSAGTLSLHHPFDADILLQQRRDDGCTSLILPGPVALRLAEAGAFARDGDAGGTVIAAWRAPERLATSAVWRERDTALVDVAIFGEAGLVAARRSPNGRAAPIPFGPVVAPRGSTGAVVVAEVLRTAASTVALRGPMVPRHAFPPGIEHSGLAHFKIDRFGLVDTGYTCRADAASKAMIVTGPPSGIIGVGGYRFPLHELEQAVGKIDTTATVAALPDPLVGQRLIGEAVRRDMVQAALNAVGINPLVAAAFRERGERSEPAGG